MSKPTLPSTYKLNLKIWGKLWPGDDEPILIHTTGDLSGQGYFFVREVKLDVDLRELALAIDPVTAQVSALRAELSAMKADHHVKVLDKEDEISKFLALTYEEPAS